MTGRPDADVIIIGAGPAGLFAAFELGIHGFSALIIESDMRVGGQLQALYADKPIFDMPGFSEILAGDLASGMLRQAERFSPLIRLGVTATRIGVEGEGLSVDLDDGETLFAASVILATGLGPLGEGRTAAPLALTGSLASSGRQLSVSTEGFETGQPGIHAIGDAAQYPGKLNLIASACHEAALAAFAIRKARAEGARVTRGQSSTSTVIRSRLSPSVAGKR